MFGEARLISGRRTPTKHKYAPFGPFGLVGSTTSLVLPRPAFFFFFSVFFFLFAFPSTFSNPPRRPAGFFFGTLLFKYLSTYARREDASDTRRRSFRQSSVRVSATRLRRNRPTGVRLPGESNSAQFARAFSVRERGVLFERTVIKIFSNARDHVVVRRKVDPTPTRTDTDERTDTKIHRHIGSASSRTRRRSHPASLSLKNFKATHALTHTQRREEFDSWTRRTHLFPDKVFLLREPHPELGLEFLLQRLDGGFLQVRPAKDGWQVRHDVALESIHLWVGRRGVGTRDPNDSGRDRAREGEVIYRLKCSRICSF